MRVCMHAYTSRFVAGAGDEWYGIVRSHRRDSRSPLRPSPLEGKQAEGWREGGRGVNVCVKSSVLLVPLRLCKSEAVKGSDPGP